MNEQWPFTFGVSKDKAIGYFLLKAHLEREFIYGLILLYISMGVFACFQIIWLMIIEIILIPFYVYFHRQHRHRMLCYYLMTESLR